LLLIYNCCSQHQDETSTSAQSLNLQAGIEMQEEINVPSEPIPSTSAATMPILEVPSTSAKPFVSLAALEAEIRVYLLKLELERKDAVIKTLKLHFSYPNICDRDDLVLLYTGLPTAAIFENLCQLLENIELNYYLKWNVQKLSKVDQLLLTLMKLRQNFPHIDLAQWFQVSQATVTNVIITHVDMIKRTLWDQLMKNVPSRLKNKSCRF
jgi:hypothetical protein